MGVDERGTVPQLPRIGSREESSNGDVSGAIDLLYAAAAIVDWLCSDDRVPAAAGGALELMEASQAIHQALVALHTAALIP